MNDNDIDQIDALIANWRERVAASDDYSEDASTAALRTVHRHTAQIRSQCADELQTLATALRQQRSEDAQQKDQEATRGGTMEMRAGQELPQGNSGDSSTPVPEEKVILEQVVAQLRHAYAQLFGHDNRWSRRGMQSFADGLIAPQIRKLESMIRGGVAGSGSQGEGGTSPLRVPLPDPAIIVQREAGRQEAESALAEAQQQIAALRAERDTFKRELQERVAAKQKAFSAFGHVAESSVCACPYCRRDAEDLAEMTAEYEMQMHAAKDEEKRQRQRAEKAEAALAAHAPSGGRAEWQGIERAPKDGKDF